MMYELKAVEYNKVSPLFQMMDHHLAVKAVIEGSVPSKIYVDDPGHPQAALTRANKRFFLAGSAHNSGFNESLRQFFAETVYPRALEAEESMFVLYYAPDDWEDATAVILKDKVPIKVQRQFYTFKGLKPDWRRLLPKGFMLRFVDRALLDEKHLKNLDDLIEEMCSERQSVEDFLEKSFGVCLIHDDEIVGWCLSEYNTADSCEVGVYTTEPYRKRGIATLMVSALSEYALSKGVSIIGWHCYAGNIPSVATALKAGFEKVRNYPVYLTWFDEVENLAMNGYFCFENQQYKEALTWYEKAFARGKAPNWAYWDAARISATLGQHDAAFGYLSQAVDRGFTEVERIKNSEHLKGLHAAKEWKVLIEQLEKRSRT